MELHPETNYLMKCDLIDEMDSTKKCRNDNEQSRAMTRRLTYPYVSRYKHMYLPRYSSAEVTVASTPERSIRLGLFYRRAQPLLIGNLPKISKE